MNEKGEEKLSDIKKTKFLFIDDSKNTLDAYSDYFDNPDISYAVCESVDEALRIIDKNAPDVIFLDNHLGNLGNEGLKVTDIIKNRKIKVYSITNDSSVIKEYQNRGIEHIDKNDLQKIQSVIDEGTK
jgi:CheY-like chemotaxis protein